MKLLAIGDKFIPKESMSEGLKGLEKYGIDVTVREWKHENLEMLQKDNLLVEQNGPDAVEFSQELIEDISEYDILIVQFAPISKKIIDKAKKLKIIGVLRGGVENIAYEYAAIKGITVMNTPGRNARAVAEFAMGMILSEVRNIARSHAALKKGEWRKKFPNTGDIPELCNKTVGIVGFGSIGQLVAGYLKAFGCNVIAYDPFFNGNFDGVNIVELPYLLKNSDVITVHARLTEDTYHLIGGKEISLMKPNAVLVNTARSGLVDEKALKEALEEGKISGAALDVFDVEPLEENDILMKLDNVTITPHVAGSTKDAFTNSPKLMRDILIRTIKGEKRLPIVNGIKPEI
ncbi:oxidoreductase [Clostridium carboxidivorans P7]|uniref:D-isomer specific 2-hydroxyacid dehydrogenase NAD-binding n=1 Tax=Clostridium carboxidivorans P7 TaxID=536227 RepID=C6PW23_9CLOT|nr:2-hydroxyacid dehydrogenase [Clostridium carboxidivorans]AKN32528.1 oxidoreductase [Clostridium carboxidivorans P7]EET86570.1 D-isomer specific 2-hydroxyacid dehydrogenase NAD-binding [Clostridium carboxidivorans P7]EFG87745.1 4-phosphoerythronate dehydrogenase [Clostridium carboxidivorans P7]